MEIKSIIVRLTTIVHQVIAELNINDLISRVRNDEKKQKKENLVFFGLVVSVLAITGIIASL